MATAISAPTGVKSALRTLDLIEYVVAQPSGVAAQEIAASLAIPVSSLSYLLATLVERGYLRRHGRKYWPGAGLDRLRRAPDDYSLADRARPLIRAIVKHVNETTSLFVPVGWEIEAVVTEISSHTLRYALEVGTRAPLYCLASGKALLASLPEDDLDRYFADVRLQRFTEFTIIDPAELRDQLALIRETGVAFTRDEFTIGISGVGTAVISRGKAIAALSVACPFPRYTSELEALIIEQIVTTAHSLVAGEVRANSAI